MREAFVSLDDAPDEASWLRFLGPLAQRAATDVITLRHVAVAAWNDDEQRLRRMFAALDRSAEAFFALVTESNADTSRDEPPPPLPHRPARYAVVIRGGGVTDDSNQYAIFDDAHFALAYLSAQFFGTEPPSPPPDHPIFIITKDEIGHPRSLFIRELS